MDPWSLLVSRHTNARAPGLEIETVSKKDKDIQLPPLASTHIHVHPVLHAHISTNMFVTPTPPQSLAIIRLTAFHLLLFFYTGLHL